MTTLTHGDVIVAPFGRETAVFEVMARVWSPTLLPLDPTAYTGVWVEDGDVLTINDAEYQYKRGLLKELPADWRELKTQARFLTNRITETQQRHGWCDGDCSCASIIESLIAQRDAVHAAY